MIEFLKCLKRAYKPPEKVDLLGSGGIAMPVRTALTNSAS
jgi:hypothetical protein